MLHVCTPPCVWWGGAQVGFLEAPSTSLFTRHPEAFALYVINRVIDLVFIIDVLLQFVTMRPLPVEKVGLSSSEAVPSEATHWEMRPHVLARDYVCACCTAPEGLSSRTRHSALSLSRVYAPFSP